MKLKEEVQNRLTSNNPNFGICFMHCLPLVLISRTTLQESETSDLIMFSSMISKRPKLAISIQLQTKKLVSRDYLTLKIFNITVFFLQKISLKPRRTPSIIRLIPNHKSFLLEPQLLVLEYWIIFLQFTIIKT